MQTLVRRRRLLLLIALGVFSVAPFSVRAEEGGSGHYTPGGTASFIDAFPLGKPGFAYLNDFAFYDGDAGVRRTIPVAGLLTANLDATMYADTSIFFYQLPRKLLGGDYGVGLSVP